MAFAMFGWDDCTIAGEDIWGNEGRTVDPDRDYLFRSRMEPRSADFQSAVSRISNPQALGSSKAFADWKSATQQVGNLRYFRFTKCV